MTTYKALLGQAHKKCSNFASAEYLLQGLANKKRYELYTDRSAVSEELICKFNELLKELKTDRPVQYIINKAFFLSCELFVDERVMVPRFETEDLVMNAALKIKNLGIIPENILDIGTGSGAIAIALAQIFPSAKVFATDISTAALEVARINIEKYNLEQRIRLYHADLFMPFNALASIQQSEGFDLIVSNPPYIPEDELENLPVSVKDYEPKIALNGGKYGFEIIENILKRTPNYLAAGGLLALEIDPGQEKLIKDLVPCAQFEKDNQELIRYAFITQ